jgi:tRNA threonylcarbamoyladenosine biosynthesis protein TsaB
MALILNLETATKVCSVTLSLDGEEIITKEMKSEKFSHSENLNLFIESIFKEIEYSINNLDAVSVSKGPGSYTGLRIGVSAAKGFCYALDIPLISIDSLESLAYLALQEPKNFAFDYIIPLFDARRMEVYSSVYTNDLIQVEDVKAEVISENSYLEFINTGKVLFLGPGAQKCQTNFKTNNIYFNLEIEVSATGMMALAEQKYSRDNFEDVAYFEPFYLKEFIAGTPKNIF